jgi:DNA-binding transcriptional LysR family regulator
MREPVVRGDIEAGRLVELDLPSWRPCTHTLQMIYRTDTAPGPAAQWLIDRFKRQA